MRAILIDTEVNNLDDHEPIEVAWCSWTIGDGYGLIEKLRYEPVNPIEPGAALVHGIIPSDLAGKPPSKTAMDFIPECHYWIGHNIDFDWEVMGSPDVKRVCTLALSRSVWPQFKCHKLGSIYYELFGLTEDSRERLSRSHSADVDVEILALVLGVIVDEIGVDSFEDLWLESEKARVPKVMAFGKHKGTAIKDVPRDYKSWLLRQDDVDPYLRKALES